MNFSLSAKYSEIDLAEVRPSDLVLIGGGCGESGGGSVTVASIQAAGQAAADWVIGVPGKEMTIYSVNGGISFGDPPGVTYSYATRNGNVNGTATVEQSSGHVTTSSSSSGGGFWASVSSFFGWLFGSH